MTEYHLECPKCGTRFELLRYAPEERVHCRKCRAAIVIPRAPGDEPPPLKEPGRVARRSAPASGKMGKLALVAVLLAAATIGGVYILAGRMEEKPKALPERKSSKPPPMTAERWQRMLPHVPLPMARDFEWVYGRKGGEVRHRVIRADVDSGGFPLFDVVISQGTDVRTVTRRVTPDGIHTLYEKSASRRILFDPPVPVLPMPLFLDSEWTYEGIAEDQDGVREHWSLRFKTEKTSVTGEWGTKTAYRVRITGSRGPGKVDEYRVYCPGIGLVEWGEAEPGGTLKSFRSGY